MIGLILHIIAVIISTIVFIPAFIYGIIVGRNFKAWNYDLAIALDQYGNVLCKYLFNNALIKINGYRFGNPDETISSVLGKNKKQNTLTNAGKILDKILDLVDKNHSIKSIDESESEHYYY